MGAALETENVTARQPWATQAVARQRAFFQSGATRSYEFRLRALKKLQRAIVEHQQDLVDALYADIGRPEFEAYIELSTLMDELKHTIKHLKSWMKPEKVPTSLWAQPGRSRIESVPLGVNFIIGPYNYPFLLAVQPLVGAIAAGNTAIVKPSSLNPTVADVMETILHKCFHEDHVHVFKGSSEVTNALLEEKFDHVFFTGSPRVGRLVMAAAAKHLTPVTLELGGKSPTIVHKDANLAIAARRILAGKMLNAGQTCIAPDHVYVHSSIKEAFEQEMAATLKEFYGDDVKNNRDFGRMINDRHFKRVAGLIKKGKLLAGGETDASQRYIAPTLLKDVTMDDAVMQEEIFGPVLPLLSYSSLPELFEMTRQLPDHPLALYLFTESDAVEREVLNNIQFGGGCINNTVMHVANPHLPFGGVGESGMGAYHGKSSFDVFSHKRSILKATTLFDIKLRYAPYNDRVNIMKRMMK